MAISGARRFLLDSMAYGLWADWEDEAREKQAAQGSSSLGEFWENPSIEVGESRDVDLTMEDESDDPEVLYAELEKETGVKFDVDVDKDDDGEVLGVMVSHGADTASVTIRDQEELDYLVAKVKEIAGLES